MTMPITVTSRMQLANSRLRISASRMTGRRASIWPAASSAKPISEKIVSQTIVDEENHCSRSPSSSTTVRQPRPSASPTTPSQSASRIRWRLAFTCGIVTSSSATSAIPNGRLMKKA
jgi:hypothetical protein